MKLISYRLKDILKETADTFTLRLEAVEGVDGYAFAAGQFNMLYAFGVGEVPISISGDPNVPEVLIHTTRAVGAVTRALCNMKPGDVLGVRGPFGTPWPLEESKGKNIILVAGGIGLAPLRPVIYQILYQRKEYGKVVILYGARTPDDVLYSKELSRWQIRFNQDVHVTVDWATSFWKGHVGVVTTLLPKAVFDPDNTIAMVCGPELMMRFSVQELLRQGVREENIFLSMERNMKCGIGLCGHCQYGPHFVCKDGPVFCYPKIKAILGKPEI